MDGHGAARVGHHRRGSRGATVAGLSASSEGRVSAPLRQLCNRSALCASRARRHTCALPMRVTDLLRTMDIFEALPAEELATIASLLRERRLRESEVLCRQGEVGDALFIVTGG